MQRIVIAFFAVAAVFMAGCKDDTTNNEKPNITSVNFISGLEVQAGDTLVVRASFTDDLGLSEAFFEVHDNFSGHSHQKVNQKFSDSKIETLNGTQDAKEIEFAIPSNAAAGPYHLEISALDQDGNRSDVKVLSFEITQDGQPQFNNLPTKIQTTDGNFNISLDVTDDVDLKEVSYQLVEHGNEVGEPLFEGDIDLDGADDKSFSFDQDFSVTGKTGEFEFIVRVFDNDENLSVAEIEIEAH